MRKKNAVAILLIATLIITAFSSFAFAGMSDRKVSGVKISQPTSSSEIKLKWTAVDGADGYEVYRSTSTTAWSYRCDVKGTQYTNKSLKLGKTYYYKVRAYKLSSSNKKIYSKFSDVKSMKTAYVKPKIEVETYGEDNMFFALISNNKNNKEIKVRLNNIEMYDSYYESIETPTYVGWMYPNGTEVHNANYNVAIKPGESKVIALVFDDDYSFDNVSEYVAAVIDYRGKTYNVIGNTYGTEVYK